MTLGKQPHIYFFFVQNNTDYYIAQYVMIGNKLKKQLTIIVSNHKCRYPLSN